MSRGEAEGRTQALLLWRALTLLVVVRSRELSWLSAGGGEEEGGEPEGGGSGARTMDSTLGEHAMTLHTQTAAAALAERMSGKQETLLTTSSTTRNDTCTQSKHSNRSRRLRHTRHHAHHSPPLFPRDARACKSIGLCDNLCKIQKIVELRHREIGSRRTKNNTAQGRTVGCCGHHARARTSGSDGEGGEERCLAGSDVRARTEQRGDVTLQRSLVTSKSV